MENNESMKKANERNANYSIECNVTQCANHCKTQLYCALDRIKVGTQESRPKTVECTECDSFEPDSHHCEGCH